MATFFQKIFAAIFYLSKHFWLLLGIIIALLLVALLLGETYQNWDDDPDRGAIAIQNGAFNESYPTPVYLDQGWDEDDSLWYYNTTQGSDLMPYDLFIVLEDSSSQELLRSNKNMDKFRYLPQKPTFFNPDGLPVGYVKDTYQGKDYIGYTCAACHTGQVNYTDNSGNTTAIRIDGGPAMADMVAFLTELQKSMTVTLRNEKKKQRFVKNVLALDNDFKDEKQVIDGLKKWLGVIELYNTVNDSKLDYGYARLDAFGRIYNRVLQHMINKEQLAHAMKLATLKGVRVLSDDEIKKVLEGVGENIITDSQFSMILKRLKSKWPDTTAELFKIRDIVFNEANAPVSYPFLWDIAQSDYVQWNGIAHNSGPGPLGRNAGEVIGVFGTLDWTSYKPKIPSLSAFLTGEKNKNEVIDFKSSINIANLQRLESHLKTLKSPVWPQDILGKIDQDKAERGQLIYANYCQSCHEVVDRENWDRLIVADMSNIDLIGTDEKMAKNSVEYSGKSGNFKHTVQSVDSVGKVIVQEDAPVAQILTAATKGVIATPDPDKLFIRRWLDRLYILVTSVTENSMPSTLKDGNYKPDTMAKPYNSLLSYKGRSLNGIWATAPYLHNGSVPTLYDLFLPKKRSGDSDKGKYRPDSFMVGSRAFDPVKVGFLSEGYDGTTFNTYETNDDSKKDEPKQLLGNKNTGHEYAAGRTAQKNGETLPALSEQQRWDLIEYIKTL